jgi:hypothetical protein
MSSTEMRDVHPWHNFRLMIEPRLMASPEQLHEAPTTAGPVSPPPPGLPAVAGVIARHPAVSSALIFCAALFCCVLVYVALTVPGSWFPGAAAKHWNARELTLARGVGNVVGDELVVTDTDASGIVLVSVNSDLRATDYAAIAWLAADVAERADVRMLWRSDYQPNKLNTAPITVEARALQPLTLAANPAWIGRVTGVALAVRGPLPQPIRIRGIVAKPMGAFEVVGDRIAEWFAFEGWSGASINVVVGGADVQDLPLPPLFAAAFLLSGCVLLALWRWRPRAMPARIAAAAWLGVFVVAWLALDTRWAWNLVRQATITERTYAGKDIRDKHLAAEDGALFAFIEKARAIMPATPARVFVTSDALYFGGRAAYELLPHNAYADRAGGAMPPAGALRPGDWVLVYQRRGVQYDAAAHLLRWGPADTVTADVKLTAPGAALFLVR